jgi:Neuraminidase (sialidase)
MKTTTCLLAAFLFGSFAAAGRAETPPAIETVLKLPPSEGHPRNSEGDFVALKDGRLLFVYSHFTGGGGDHDRAFLAGRYSSDGGKTWTDKDEVIVEREGDWNVMSVSLLRLKSGAIALFYLRKNSLTDCRPLLRLSTDEAKTWSQPIECITDKIGYYVLNNDRAEQLTSGRLILPVCHHANAGGKFDGSGTILCYLSDDDGKTWRRSKTERQAMKDGKRLIAQEPLMIERKDKSLLLLARSNEGSQLQSTSSDGGDTWSELIPSNIKSPLSPASIERLPSGDLLLVWNDHSQIDAALKGKRTPLSAAISKDDGQTWQPSRTLFDNPSGWYCYTAIEIVGDHVLLGHCAGDRSKNNGLAETHITRIPIAWFYAGVTKQ